METGTPKAGKSRRALLWTSTSYFGEGLPWSFLHQMATEFLTQIRASNTQISSTSLLHLAVTFKFLWSPLVDLFGRLRTWIIAARDHPRHRHDRGGRGRVAERAAALLDAAGDRGGHSRHA